MTNWKRAAAVAGLAVLLLAAGEAPDARADIFGDQSDKAAGAAIVPAMVERIEIPAAMSLFGPSIDFPIVEERFDHAEPELGPVLPEAGNLPQMVQEVRELVRAEPAIVSSDEMDCLATAVYFESKSEPLEGQLAVAQVILNRVDKGRFGGSICDVVKAPYQFSFVRGGELPQPRHEGLWLTAQAVAVIAASEGWNDVVGDATHFHATRVNPGWRLKRVASIGRHIFYR